MILKNRFKNRFISHKKWVEWFTAKDFKASCICSLAKFERLRNNKISTNYQIKKYG